MFRFLFALPLSAALAGCEGKKSEATVPPASNVFDKKEMPKGAVPMGGGNKKAKEGSKGE